MINKKFSHALLIEDGKVLLGKKKRGYSEGVISVYGGKPKELEKFEEALLREFKEESALEIVDFEQVACLFYTDSQDYLSEHRIYLVTKYTGNLIETEEMTPYWYDFSKIPYEEMWEDSINWLPLVLDGKKVRGHFDLDGHNKIINKQLDIIDSFV